MADDKTKADLPPSAEKLLKQVLTNLDAELDDLGSSKAKYTRKTGMIDPDLDIGTTPYDPSKPKEKG